MEGITDDVLHYSIMKVLEQKTKMPCTGEHAVVTEILKSCRNMNHASEELYIEIKLHTFCHNVKVHENKVILTLSPCVVSWVMAGKDKKHAAEQLTAYFFENMSHYIELQEHRRRFEKCKVVVGDVKTKVVKIRPRTPFEHDAEFSSSMTYSISLFPAPRPLNYADASIIRTSAFLSRASRGGVVNVCGYCRPGRFIHGDVSSTTLEGNTLPPVSAMPFIVSNKPDRNSGELRILFLASPGSFAMHRWKAGSEEDKDALINDTYRQIKTISGIKDYTDVSKKDIYKNLSKINFSRVRLILFKSFMSFKTHERQ